VTKPEGDDFDGDAGLKQVHGGGVSEGVCGDASIFERGGASSGALHGGTESECDAVPREWGPALAGEDCVVGADLVIPDPSAESVGQQ
jgi:hypothetical protein